MRLKRLQKGENDPLEPEDQGNDQWSILHS